MIDDRDIARALVPLKRHFGWSAAVLDDFARAIASEPRIHIKDLRRAVTTALKQPSPPAIHELIGLSHMERRNYQERASREAVTIEEGDFVKGHDCHNCGGNVEYRAPHLYCPACKAVQQNGRDMSGNKKFTLEIAEQLELRTGDPHEWPETPEEARERIKGIVARLAGGMDMNAALEEPLPNEAVADVVNDLQQEPSAA